MVCRLEYNRSTSVEAFYQVVQVELTTAVRRQPHIAGAPEFDLEYYSCDDIMYLKQRKSFPQQKRKGFFTCGYKLMGFGKRSPAGKQAVHLSQ